jgi:hypothetical protein
MSKPVKDALRGLLPNSVAQQLDVFDRLQLESVVRSHCIGEPVQTCDTHHIMKNSCRKSPRCIPIVKFSLHRRHHGIASLRHDKVPIRLHSLPSAIGSMKYRTRSVFSSSRAPSRVSRDRSAAGASVGFQALRVPANRTEK